MTHDEIIFEKNMLEGSINKMITTKDFKELNTQFSSGIVRIYSIYMSKYNELVSSNTCKELLKNE